LTIEEGKPVPCELSSPARSTDTSQDQHDSATAEPGPGWVSSVQTPTRETPHLPTSFELKFKVFSTSDDLRQKVKQVQEQNYDRLLGEVPGTPLVEIQWTADHDTVADQLTNDLVWYYLEDDELG
jgi:hypothetical protein